jgi:hypothetical protein
MKRERLDFLADNPHYTKRFAYCVGRRCRVATIKDVAADLKLDLAHGQDPRPAIHVARAGTPSPQVIGIDEIAIRKGHVMIANVRIHSPEVGSFQFSHSPPMPNGLPSFMAMAKGSFACWPLIAFHSKKPSTGTMHRRRR